MLTRILAYGLSYCEGITFSKAGLSDVDEPALSVFDLTGRRLVWIEIGSPAADRLHKASKATPKVVIYTSADLGQLRREATSRPVHKLEDIDVWHIEPALLAALEADVDRKTDLEVLRTGDRLYVTTRSGTHEGALVKVSLAE